MLMRRFFLFCIFLILGMHIAGAESIITVDVNESGNASWTMERSMPLTKPEFNEWEAALKTGQNISRYRDIPEFITMINLFQNSAKNFSNRSMEISNVNISFDTKRTISGDFGNIRYSFVWQNFSSRDSENIFVGDAFSEQIALSSDTILIINIPEGYNASSVDPIYDKRDGNSLIWSGTMYGNFSKGEPALVLSRIDIFPVKSEKFMTPWILIAILVFLSAALVIIWKERSSANLREKGKELGHGHWALQKILKISEVWNKLVQLLHKETGINVEEIEKAAKEQTSKEFGSEIPQLPQAEEDLEYEEMIERYLIRSGGQSYQSEIVNEIKLSKSKISLLLASMKEEGRILKITKGKENLIRLVRKDPVFNNGT